MNWWDFQDKTFLVFFIISVGMLTLIILLTISFALSSNFSKRNTEKIKEQCFTIRVFIIDIKKNLVTYFNRSNIKNKKTMDMASFYERFHENDIEKVKNWIFSICVDSKNVEQYLEADVLGKKGKTSTFSLLKLIKYDPDRGLIHLESHFLRYITPANSASRKRIKANVSGVVKRKDMETIISKYKSQKGFTFAIKFINHKPSGTAYEKGERFQIMTLKNEIYPFLSAKSPRHIVEITDNEMLLFDLRISYRDDAVHLATSIAHALRKCIIVNGFSDTCDFAIGIVENNNFYQDFNSIINYASDTAFVASQNKKPVMLYQKTSSQTHDAIIYKTTIADIIKSKKIKFSFRPILKADEGSSFGWFTYVKVYDLPINNMVELSKYSSKTGENRTLLAYVARQIFPKFQAQKPNKNAKLFFRASMLDIDNIIEIFPQIPSTKESKTIIMFDEQEVDDMSYQLDKLIFDLKRIKEAGYELALSLKDRDLLLDPSVYYNFDYFIAGATMIGEIRKNNRVRLSIHTLIEQLLKYKKPIIATDLEGWSAVELIIKSGIYNVSCESIAPSSTMIVPTDKKKLEKLKVMANKYK